MTKMQPPTTIKVGDVFYDGPFWTTEVGYYYHKYEQSEFGLYQSAVYLDDDEWQLADEFAARVQSDPMWNPFQWETNEKIMDAREVL